MKFHKFFFGDLPAADSTAPDPRKILNNERTDLILSAIAKGTPFTADDALVKGLIDIGIIRNNDGKWHFACPVFLKADEITLRRLTSEHAAAIADKLLTRKADFFTIVSHIKDAFPPERHIYHLLCAAVFDGRFFDRLAESGTLTVSKPQKYVQDYLPVIYEDDPALNSFSAEILCSYNRLTAKAGNFISFGDAAGDRRDFFRWYQRITRGNEFVTPYKMEIPLPEFREELARQFIRAIEGHNIRPEYAELFETFGYLQNGNPAVPVYNAELMRETVAALDGFTAELILTDMKSALEAVASAPELTAIRHGVPVPDVANEVYHLLFGQINEYLVRGGIAAAPEYRPGEGRYFKCFEIN